MMNENTQHKEQQIKDLYEIYYAPFCIYAKRFLKDITVCEDIVSDAFANLWVNSDNSLLEERGSAISYLKTIVHNKCLNYLKHQNYEDEYSEQYIYRAPIYSESPESIYTLDEMYKLLSDAIKKLPDKYREVYIKSFLEDKKQTEIAKELNVSVKTVERYRTEIIEKLRKELKDYIPLVALLGIIIS